MSTVETPKTKSSLLAMLQQGATQFEILGYLVWWNIREVKLTRDQFIAALKAAGLPEKYAREHNYRATLLRAIKDMEETGLVRPVKEDPINMIFQFTAELPSEDPTNPHLTYKPMVVVNIDKEAYVMFAGDAGGEDSALAKSICGITNPQTGEPHEKAEEIKQQIINAFNANKATYKSSDLTRYIQRILEDNADIISLRPQGAIYFVPATYQSVVHSVNTLVNTLGYGCTFEYAPIPNVDSAQKMVGDSFEAEVLDLFKNMDEEVKDMKESKKPISEKWVDTRLDRIKKIQKRIDMYAEVLGVKAQQLAGNFDALSLILRPRNLDL
jgi:hypothetical protein